MILPEKGISLKPGTTVKIAKKAKSILAGEKVEIKWAGMTGATITAERGKIRYSTFFRWSELEEL